MEETLLYSAIRKDHLVALKNSLIARVNIIRYLANKTLVHINALPYLTKTLVLNKMDYCLTVTLNLPIFHLFLFLPKGVKCKMLYILLCLVRNLVHE